MEPIWMARARREIGVKERPGQQHNTRILEYHNATRLHADEDEVPWCSAFVCWVMEGSDIASTRSAAARSWLAWGEKLDAPRAGCVVILSRHSPDNPKSAHVGFYVGGDDHSIHVLGGNQANQVCVRAYEKDRVLGYRWPLV